jgi:hypothetical protein
MDWTEIEKKASQFQKTANEVVRMASTVVEIANEGRSVAFSLHGDDTPELLAGRFICQHASVMGKMANDPLWQLFWHAMYFVARHSLRSGYPLAEYESMMKEFMSVMRYINGDTETVFF